MIVVDVGCARYGQDFSIERLIERFRPRKLYGFDPNLPQWETPFLRSEAAIWSAELGAYLVGETTVRLERMAAWTYDGEIGFRSEGLRSWVTSAPDAEKVPCFDLARFIAGLDDDEVVLKIDAEGAEYDLLEHLIDTRTDALLRLVWVEWHEQVVQRARVRRQVISERLACELEEWTW
jgi:FkbM family methyltransferase